MSEFDHAMQGQNIAAVQSMRHHNESAEGPGGGLGLDSNLFWVFKSGLQDYSASVMGNIDKIFQSLFSAIFPEQSLSIFSSGNPNITLFGFPVLLKSTESGGDGGGGAAEGGTGDDAQYTDENNNSEDTHNLMGDYPHTNQRVMDDLGDDSHDFNQMQHHPMQEHDHSPPPPITPQTGRGSSHHLEAG